MRILETVLFEFILGYVLQGFSYYVGLHAFSKKKIEVKTYVVASLAITVVFFVMRLLPINFGIHTILNSICVFLIGVLYLKLPPLSTIIGLLIILVFLLITEFGDIYVLTSILGKEKFDLLMSDRLYQNLLGLPSSLVFALLNAASYYLLIIRKRKKSAANGKISA